MISQRPKLVLWAMVVLAIVLGVLLFARPGGNRDQPANPAPHAPDQTPM